MFEEVTEGFNRMIERLDKCVLFCTNIEKKLLEIDRNLSILRKIKEEQVHGNKNRG